ncbi:MAG: DNA primase [Candidatus Pacebacteria bacterium]|nr:DNA primase [Candidatus Paceibacterota bacterium]MBP9716174.1 DNA primase [Candidatus Paceibacterota bacterium]
MSLSVVPTIKERLNIVDVLSSYITVEGSGKNFKAKCPFHNEKTPSFYISPERNSYYCFGCGAKGDIFSFVEHFEGTDFLGALKILASRAGVQLEDFSKSRESKDEIDRLYDCMEEATKFFQSELLKNPEARLYLINRGVNDESIENFRIGYVPNTWRSASDYLLKKGFSKTELENVGLIKTKEIAKSATGGSPDSQSEFRSFYDRFRGRIMFPISDSSGRVIAFSGRIFGRPDDEEAKYLNSPDTKLFNKSNVLFGIDRAKNAIRTRGYSIVVEGQLDLVLSHQAGFTNTVATSGTALADAVNTADSRVNNLGLLRRLSPNIIFAFDGDNAGIRACGRGSMIALGLDMQVKVAVLPAGEDPADIIKKDSEIWKNIIKNSVNIITFYLSRINNDTTELRIRGRKVREVIFPYLAMIKSSIELDSYIQEISQTTGINQKAISDDFQDFLKVHTPTIQVKEVSNQIKKDESVPRKTILLKRLFGIYHWQKGNKDISNLVENFSKSINEVFGDQYFEGMHSEHVDESDSLSFEAEMWYGGKIDTLSRDVVELLLNTEEELIKERLVIISNKINSSPDSLPKDLIKEHQILTQRREHIKNSRLK